MAKKVRKAKPSKGKTKAAKKSAKAKVSRRASRRAAGKAKAKVSGARKAKKARRTRAAAKSGAKAKVRKTTARKTAKKARKASTVRAKARRSAARGPAHPGGTTARARAGDPGTSHDAAAFVRDELPNLENMAYGVFAREGMRGAILDEVAAGIGVDKVTASPRMRPLCDKGLIFPSVERRMGRSGRMQTVWKLVKYREFEPVEAQAA